MNIVFVMLMQDYEDETYLLISLNWFTLFKDDDLISIQ